MKRKAIERIKPKKPEGKGLTATLQELGEILILNIYQAKELLVRYCINYETGEHEYWKEQHGWRKGGILNALNEDWRDWEYLRAYRKHGKRIKRIESEIEEIRNMKMYPSSINNGMPHGSNQSDLSSYAVALQEREDELYQEGVKQVQTYKDIEYRINKLENQDERDVMFYKYIKGFTWWQIAQLMEYSESWIYELHGRALKNIQIN